MDRPSVHAFVKHDSTLAGPIDKAQSMKEYRNVVTQELVETERKYVQSLTQLHDLKSLIEQRKILSKSVLREIFFNLDAILDFCNTFLGKLEETNLQPEIKPRWGSVFADFGEACDVYVPYIGNQRKAIVAARRKFDKISQIDHPLTVDIHVLEMFIMMPLPRLIKYRLLLEDLRDRTGADKDSRADLTRGIDAMNRTAEKFNAAIELDLRTEALEFLCARIQDWKDLRVDRLGDLVLFSALAVLKDGVQKQYKVYLFERYLIFCREHLSPISLDRLRTNDEPKREIMSSDTEVKLKLKGWISMRDKPEILQFADYGVAQLVSIRWVVPQPDVQTGNSRIQVNLGTNDLTKSVDILFPNDFIMAKWFRTLEDLRIRAMPPT